MKNCNFGHEIFMDSGVGHEPGQNHNFGDRHACPLIPAFLIEKVQKGLFGKNLCLISNFGYLLRALIVSTVCFQVTQLDVADGLAQGTSRNT